MSNRRHSVQDKAIRNGSSLALGLTLVVGFLILYGSLFPFGFVSARHFHVLEALGGLRFNRPGRGDLVANILLYVPFGLCLLKALPDCWHRLCVLGLTVVCGTLLSLTIELLQTLESTRVSSFTDVLANTAGTVLGAVAGRLYASLGSAIRLPGVACGQAKPVPLAILVLWLVFRLAPFVPTIDWQKYKDALKPLMLYPQLKATSVLYYLVGWLVVVVVVRQLWKRECVVAVMAVLMASVLLGRLVVVSQRLSLNEVLAMVLVMPVASLLWFFPDSMQRWLIALGLAASISMQGLEPFDFVTRPRAFSWIPFQSSLSGHIEVNYLVFIGKCFWYSALVWCTARIGLGILCASLTAALCLLMIEVVQVWLPNHSPEITDPLLAMMMGLLLARMDAGVTHAATPTVPAP